LELKSYSVLDASNYVNIPADGSDRSSKIRMNHALFVLVDQGVSFHWMFVARTTTSEAWFGYYRAIGLIHSETCRLYCQNSAVEVCGGAAVQESFKRWRD